MSWGVGSWGTSTWGGGDPPVSAMSVLSAVAFTTRSVVVTLSAAALSGSPVRRGDALNPATWRVEEIDVDSATVRRLNVMAVRGINPDHVLEIGTLQALSNHRVVHRVTALGLLDASGAIVSGDSAVQEFLGLVFPSRPVLLGAPGSVTPVDTRNDVVQGIDGTAGGSPMIDSTGDYATHGGTDLFWKMVYRRLTTVLDGFFHLPRGTFGLGLRPKNVVRAADLPALELAIARQVQMEPECRSAEAAITLERDGRFTVTISVVFRDGATERRDLRTRTE